MDIIFIFLAVSGGVIAGVIHNIILIRHVLPYMKKRGIEIQGPLAPFQINKTLSKYYKIDDPNEKKMKITLRILNFIFLIFMFMVVLTLFLAWRELSAK